jgi:hypothetical protein
VCNFANQSAYTKAYFDLQDTYTLARSAYRLMDTEPNHTSIARYFNIHVPGLYDRVKRVLRGVTGTSGIGNDLLTTPGFEFEIWQGRSSHEYSSSLDPPPCSSTDDRSHMSPRDCDRLDPKDLRKAWVVACPKLWERKLLDEIPCKSLSHDAPLDFVTAGSVMLHDFMHWTRMTQNEANVSIGDYFDPHSDPLIKSPYGA